MDILLRDFTIQEHDQIKQVAALDGRSINSWCKRTLLAQIQDKITDPKHLVCPKCKHMTLDYGRGFNYQCLRVDCCWQGNEALTFEAWQSKSHVTNKTAEVRSNMDVFEEHQSFPKQLSKLIHGKTNHLATIAQVQVHDGEDVIVQKRNKQGKFVKKER